MNHRITKAIVPVLYATFLSFLIINASNFISYSIIGFLVFFPIFFLKPKIYFIGFILIRPIIDLSLRGDIAVGGLSAILVMPLIILCCKDIFLNPYNLFIIKRNAFLRKFNIIFSIFLATSIFSFFNTNQFVVSLADFLRLISIFVSVNYSVVCFSGRIRRFVFLILGSSIVPLLFGLYQLIFKKGVSESIFNRVYGTFVHPNVFAEFLLLTFFAILYFLSSSRLKAVKKFFCIQFMIICLLLLFNTFTRNVWIALFSSLIFFILIRTDFSKKILYSTIIFILLLVGLPFITSRFEDITINTGYKISSWQWRLELWSRVLTNLKEHPIVGHGLGMFQRTIMVMAHNDYLRVAYEIGMVGIVLYLSLLLFILFYSIKRMVASQTLFDANRFKIIICLIISILIISLADNLVRGTVILMYYFMTIAVFASDTEKANSLFSVEKRSASINNGKVKRYS